MNQQYCEKCSCYQGQHMYDCPILMETFMTSKKKEIMFRGEKRFLSNFYPSIVSMDGVEYPSVEHAYQAAKTFDHTEREEIRTSGSPANAKRLGTKFNLRPDWNTAKLDVMEKLLVQKFAPGKPLSTMLRDINGDLVETNWWHDNFWGSCMCDRCNDKGENHLGKLLMKIRAQLLSEHEQQ